MIPVVIDRPYRFVPPYTGVFWARLVTRFVPIYLRRSYGVESIEFRGGDRLAAAFVAGHGVLLAPNHARPCDPFVIGLHPSRLGRPCHFVAAWHVFTNQNRFQAWLLRRIGAFSLHRWGLDRESLKASIQILADARRPLLLFPEGMITRANDRLGPLLDGAAFIARTAARHRAEADPPGSVVVIPVAVRYLFRGNLAASVEPVLTDVEARLSWRPHPERQMLERIRTIAEGLLTLKEIEYLGSPRTGTLAARMQSLVDAILHPMEIERLGAAGSGPVVERVKRLRTEILPELLRGETAPAARDRAWRQVADCYLAQQLDCYPPDYLAPPTTVERILETVERIEEDLTDTARAHRPLHAIVQFDEPIPVEPQRQRGGDEALKSQIESRLRALLAESAGECTPWQETSSNEER